jgi:hypothetical protein
MIKLFWLLLTALIIGGFSRCMHDPNEGFSTNGNLILHLHTVVDTNTVFQYDSVYKVTGNRKIALTFAQLYVSDIQLVKSDGSVYDMTGTVALKTLSQEIYQLGTLPNGSYKAIRFSVGLDPAENLKSPSSLQDSLFNKPAMWFGNTAQPQGFVFLNLRGKIDTTTNSTGTLANMQNFSYKIGKNANYKQVVMDNVSFTVTAGQSQYVHLLIDYNKLFAGIQLNNPNNLAISSIADNSTDLAKKICNNIPSMFILDPN